MLVYRNLGTDFKRGRKIIKEIKNGKSYEDALKEGQLELFELLKKEAIY